MGIPAISQDYPADLASTTVLISRFDAIYNDAADALVASSVVIDIDTVNTFDSANKITSTFSSVVSGSTCRMAKALAAGTWYWRATATNADGTTVSPTRSLTIAQTLKRILYLYENVAKYGPDWAQKRILYLYENIAKYGPDFANTRALYQYENITDDPPSPTIYSLSTTRTSQGSVVTIYGNGFGSKAASDPENEDRTARGYGGSVYLGDQACGIISWSWQAITFTVPADAVSGAVKVRLTTPDPPGVRDSNVIGLEVYEQEQAYDIGLEFFLCDASNPNTILAQLEGASGKSIQVLINNPGSGQFAISRYDDKGGNRELIADQNFILVRLDGVDIFKWIIESRKPVYVDSGEQQMIAVSGRGVLAIMEHGVVYPTTLTNPENLERSWTDVHAAAIVKTLIEEAQARGAMPGVILDFTADSDSVGNPWDDLTSISFHMGTPVLEVAKKFSEGLGIFDVEMTPTMHLRLYKGQKGTDRSDTVRYHPGQAILEHNNQSDSTKLTNVVLVEGEGGALAEVIHPTSPATYGRREGYLQARNVPNEYAALMNQGNSFLNVNGIPKWGIQGKVTKFVDSIGNVLKPFESYLVGDWIWWTVPPEGADTVGFDGKVRVKGVTIAEDDNGNPDYTLELNNIMLEREIRMAQMVERMSMFSRDAVLSNPDSQPAAPIAHNHSHSLLLGLGDDDHKQYYNATRHAADTHAFLTRVTGLKKSGSPVLTGEVTFAAGTNVTLIQDSENKVITIAASGGSSGGGESWTPADTPAAAGDYDEEMDGALDAAWIWQASSGTPAEDNNFTNWVDTAPSDPRYSVNGKLPGNLMLQPVAGQIIKTYRAFPYAADIRWVIGAKVRLLGATGTDDRIVFAVEKDTPTASRDEAYDGINVVLRRSGNNSSVRSYLMNGGSSTPIAPSESLAVYTAYFAISQNTDNKLTAWISLDGVGWTRLSNLITGQPINGNVGYVFISVRDYANTSGTGPVIGVVDWIRFRNGTNDPLDLFLT